MCFIPGRLLISSILLVMRTSRSHLQQSKYDGSWQGMLSVPYQNVRARAKERACMMWYRTVAHVSLYSFWPPPSALFVRSALPPPTASREFRITPTSARASEVVPKLPNVRRQWRGGHRCVRPSAFVLCGFVSDFPAHALVCSFVPRQASALREENRTGDAVNTKLFIGQ